MLPFVKIDSPKVKQIKIQDNGEELIDLLKDCPQILVDQSRSYAQDYSPSISLLRQSVAQKLIAAQNKLPSGIKFKIIEGFRPIEVQKRIFEEQIEFLSQQHPDWSRERLKEEASLFVAPPESIPPHSTGGTVDLTLIDEAGQELDMGTKLNDEYREDTYTLSNNISTKALDNRKILITALEAEGFANYPAEWWHWSYGDQYWAYIKKEQVAIYGSIKE